MAGLKAAKLDLSTALWYGVKVLVQSDDANHR